MSKLTWTKMTLRDADWKIGQPGGTTKARNAKGRTVGEIDQFYGPVTDGEKETVTYYIAYTSYGNHLVKVANHGTPRAALAHAKDLVAKAAFS